MENSESPDFGVREGAFFPTRRSSPARYFPLAVYLLPVSAQHASASLHYNFTSVISASRARRRTLEGDNPNSQIMRDTRIILGRRRTTSDNV